MLTSIASFVMPVPLDKAALPNSGPRRNIGSSCILHDQAAINLAKRTKRAPGGQITR